MTDLRDHAVAGGYRCRNWQKEHIVPLALESGSCSDVDVFSIYSNQRDLARQLKHMRELGPDRSALLVGDDWLINAPEATVEMLQKALGGKITFA